MGLNYYYGPYAHFGYWTLVSDPQPKKKFQKLESFFPKVSEQAEAKRGVVIKEMSITVVMNKLKRIHDENSLECIP